MSNRNVYTWVAFVVLVIATAVQCSSGGGGDPDPIGPPTPAPSAIAITTTTVPPPRFIPVSTALAVGGSVTWTNTSSVALPVNHDLVATTSNWHLSRTLSPGQSFQTTIEQAGTYRYQCTIHPGMNGTIEVR